jgi:hypothetical protein
MKYISPIFRISDEEKSMSQRFPKSIWVVTVLTAVILGVWPGIVLAQENYTGFVALIGWFAFPLGIYQLLTGQFRFDSLAQFQWLMSLAYPFAMLGYSACAYWTIRRTGIMRKGLIVVVIAAFVSTLVTIPVAMIAMSIIQHMSVGFFGLFLGYLPALGMHAIILIHLLISAVLGWLIGAGLARLPRRNTLVVA